MNYEYFYFWGEIHLCTGTSPTTTLSPPTSTPSSLAQPTPALTHTHTQQRQIIGLDAEFFSVIDGSVNKRGRLSKKPRVGVLALVSKDDDGSCKVLFRKIVKPRLTANDRLTLNENFTGVTWADYHNGICYDDAMVEVKSLLKDAIVVGHNIESDERALCFQVNQVAHRVYDTATNARLNDLVPSERGKIYSKLAGLASYLLGKGIQSETVHDPVEDAFATLEIFLKHKEIFEEAVWPCSSKTATLQNGRTIRLE